MPFDGQTFVLPDLEFDERVRRGLRDAADYIEKHGWCQEHYFHDGQVCAWGAVLKIEWDDPFARRAMCERIEQAIDAPDIEEWNDTPGRTQAEVVQALRDAAKL